MIIYLLTVIGFSPGGRSTVHIYTQTIHRTTQQFWMSVGRAPSWLVILLSTGAQDLRVMPWSDCESRHY